MIRGILSTILLFLSIVVYTLTIVSAYGGSYDPRIIAFPSFLLLAFPIFVVLTIIVGVIWVVLRHRIIALSAVAVLLVVFPKILMFCPLNLSTIDIKPTDRTFTLLTWNIHLAIDQEPEKTVSDYSRTLNHIIESNADVVCLQESYSFNNKAYKHYQTQIDSLYKIYSYRVMCERNTDLQVLSKYPVKAIDFSDKVLFGIRAYKLTIDRCEITLLNLHLRSFFLNGDESNVIEKMTSIAGAQDSAKKLKQSVYAKLSEGFKKRAEDAEIAAQFIDSTKGNLVVCGDFNDVTDSWAYRKIAGDRLNDAFRQLHLGPTFTFNSEMLLFHIDHILYRGDELDAVGYDKAAIKSSDHCPIIVEFRIN